MTPFRPGAAAAALLLLSVPAAAGPLGVRAKAISLPDLDGTPATVLILTVPLSRVSFRFYVTAEFRDGGDVVASRNWVMDASVRPEAAEAGEIRRQLVFHLPSGKLEARIRVEDLDADRGDEVHLDVLVPDFDRPGLRLSDVVVGSCADTSGKTGGDADAPWAPVSLLLEPRFGNSNPDLCVWAQATDSDRNRPDSVYAVRTRIRNDRRKTVLEASGTAPRRNGGGTVRVRPDIGSLTQGTYVLEVEVSLGDDRAEGEARFEIDESRLSFGDDPERIRELLSYVATNRELIELEQTPSDSLGAFWERFWQRRDPEPESGSNPALAEFLERVDFASLHYGTLEPGWRTDRGRIYIQFGPPDREENNPQGPSGIPTLLWYYYDRHLTFVFQDPEGLGAYRLAGRRRMQGRP